MTTAPVGTAEPGPPERGSEPDSGAKKNTLFIKNLPEDATKEQLELVFSEVGKLRHCFVVKKRKTEAFRGIGFVTFVDEDAMQSALKRSFKLGHNQLDVSIAEDKKKQAKGEKSSWLFVVVTSSYDLSNCCGVFGVFWVEKMDIFKLGFLVSESASLTGNNSINSLYS